MIATMTDRWLRIGGGFALGVALAVVVPGPARAASREDIRERMTGAARVLDEILAAPDKGIPKDLLDRATCALVIPSMKKAGFGLGGRYGKGVVACRREAGGWGAPSMVLLGGGSIGLQIGVSEVDVVMLIMNPDGIDLLLKSKFTLGGDASVAAGPVGRAGTAETDAFMTAKILTWSRSRGAFAGLELKGAVLKQDKSANRALYERSVEARTVLLGEHTTVPPGAQVFVGALTRHSPARTKKAP